nr:hypothetical protein [Tanacetum cinerariifolium]
MADLSFAPQHNMIAYLEKTNNNVEFHQIVDFLTLSSIHHSLTVSPTIYASNIEQFWNTATSQTINDEKQIHATVDGKTIATLNKPTPQEEGSSNGPERQETMRAAMAQIRSEGAVIQSIDPPLSTSCTVRSGEDRMEHDIKLTDPILQTPHDSPLSGGHTLRSDEGSMKLKELTDLCTTLLQKVLDLENVKTAQAKKIVSLKKRVTKMKQKQSSRISGFHPFRVGTYKRHSLGRRKVSKQGRKNLKSQQMF